MENVLHRADKRGRGDHGWLSTRYSFSFADWYEPMRMGFGALRVLNDDTIAPLSGFPMHSHRDMEIITMVTHGTLTHQDSLGNLGIVQAGDVQVMSAGSGIVHSEYNAESHEPLELFQIWIATKTNGIPPRYDQKSFTKITVEDGIVPLVGHEGELMPLSIQQDAFISRTIVDTTHPREYRLHNSSNGVYIFVLEGSVDIADEHLLSRDALGLSAVAKLDLATTSKADILLIEIPS